MRIVVCTKQVPDPEAPVTAFSLSDDQMQIVPGPAVKPVISTFDENAIEAGLALREAHGGTVIALGLVSAATDTGAVKRALHMGADEAVVVVDPNLTAAGPAAVAATLAAAVNRIGGVDLVLCGRQAGEGDWGMVGVGIAHALDWPCATLVQRLAVTSAGVEVDRPAEGGTETLKVPLPAVLTVTNELNRPRPTSVRMVMASQRKQIPAWPAADLGLDPVAVAAAAGLELVRLELPVRERQCMVISGESEEESAVLLAERLHAAGLM